MKQRVSFAATDTFNPPVHRERKETSSHTAYSIESLGAPTKYRLNCSVHGLVSSNMTVEEANVLMVRHNRESHRDRIYDVNIRRFRV